MRTLPVIHEKWASGGPFVGDKKPTTRVTVQMPWWDLADTPHPKYFLRRTWNSGMGSSSSRGYPMRWWQRMDNSQEEMEIPNISNITVDRNIDQDAGTFQFQIKNQWMYVNGGAPDQSVVGQPGYFSPTRGDSAEARARWGHEPNDWNDVLVPNALIRIYTGFGGWENDIDAEVAAGNLCLYFVGLVDEVTISTSGALSIRGRDMMKLLIDQQLFPPLIPENKYPLAYERWRTEQVLVRMAPKMVVQSAGAAPSTLGTKASIYDDSSADRWYGSNAMIHGHRATDSLDNNPHSYALGVGNSGPDKPFATDWWQYNCGQQMNAIHVHPWKGGYTMYVSVMEGGAWQGSQTIPYDPSHLFATQSPAVNTGANIPYVASFTVPHEAARDYVLPRTYNADKVRISFRNLAYSGLGVWKYRAGVREFRILGMATTTTTHGTKNTVGTSILVDAYCQAAGARYVPGKTYSQGYVTVSNHDQQDAFGDARGLSVSAGSLTASPTAVCFSKSGDGYYVLDSGGRVRAHGDAVHYGNVTMTAGIFAWDMALTHTGKGYWILMTNGLISSHGDAAYMPPVTVTADTGGTASIHGHPTAQGVWVLRNDGKVFARGAATHFGDVPTAGEDGLRFIKDSGIGLQVFINASERAQCIRRTSTGNGYWVLSTKGRVWAFGDAVHHGQPYTLEDHSKNLFTQSYWEILPTADDKGYVLMHASGKISPHGDVEIFGGPIPGGYATLRHDGNYLDYTDIIKDLILWSGFLLFSGTWPLDQPAPVYAGLETTGAFSKDRLPDEMFDKKPVIDAITALKEVVGYISYIDTEGRFRFQSPNWWHIGNFDENGFHRPALLEIDEKLQLTDYTLSNADEPMRSSITISSHDPFADMTGTITSTYTPPSAKKLRGMVKPSMWVNDFFVDPIEQQIMAELIGLHISFQERIGQLSCYAHPGLDIDDQIRIFERQSAETYVHYVRGISFNHDLDSGAYTTTITTHWLAAGTDSGDVVGGESMPVSSLLSERIAAQQFGKYSRNPPEVPNVPRPTPPSNDNFASAIALTGNSGSLTNQSNMLATAETGEPAPTSGYGTESIWYKITPTSSGTLTIKTEGSTLIDGTDEFDTVLSVWTGSAVNSLTLVAENDDTTLNPPGDYTSRVVFSVTAGTTYYIRIHGYAASTDDTSDKIKLTWQLT